MLEERAWENPAIFLRYHLRAVCSGRRRRGAKTRVAETKFASWHGFVIIGKCAGFLRRQDNGMLPAVVSFVSLLGVTTCNYFAHAGGSSDQQKPQRSRQCDQGADVWRKRACSVSR